VRYLTVIAAVAFAAFVSTAGASTKSPGDPPAGMSPVAGSVFKAQFALCSLERVSRLARADHLAIEKLAPAAAATRVAQAHERDRGRAAVSGCRAGLLYRAKNDQALATLRRELSDRVVAEKYVVAVYALIVAMFFAWVVLHAARVSRLERRVAATAAELGDLPVVDSEPA
jgi:hypothetical protein